MNRLKGAAINDSQIVLHPVEDSPRFNAKLKIRVRRKPV
jgi:hypothetical protein